MAMKHYKGKIGEFDYDDKMFRINTYGDGTPGNEFLQFNDSYRGPIDLPEGCISCRGMFNNVEIKPGCYMRNFDTSAVEDMACMFCECKMPENFSLGNKFDTSKVEDMESMFCDCKMSKNFSLGDKFDTSKVKDMWCMFDDCKMPEGFSLGDKFNVSHDCDISNSMRELISDLLDKQEEKDYKAEYERLREQNEALKSKNDALRKDNFKLRQALGFEGIEDPTKVSDPDVKNLCD